MIGALGIGAAAAMLAAVPLDDAKDAGEIVRSVIRVTDADARLALVDVDGDLDLDLVTVGADGVSVRQLGADGAYSETVDLHIAWPSTDAAWTLVDVDRSGTVELALFVDAGQVRTLSLDAAAREPEDGRLVLEFEGALPRGHFRMDFFRDIDRDGRLDLVLPSFGSYALHLQREDGSFADPIRVVFETDISFEVGAPDELDGSFGQEVTIPWFSLEDIDGDGDMDLLSETSDEVLVHLATPHFESEPTWRIDLAALRRELPADEGIDLGNLLERATRQTRWRVVDLDGNAPNDLIVQVGGKLRVYLGGAVCGPVRAPDQILKASGNVMWFFLRDSQGDDLPDLHIIRGEKISLSQVLRWLVLPGGLDFDLFTYENQSRLPDAETFSRRPTRRNTLTLKIPRLLAFVNELEEREQAGDDDDLPTRRVALDGDGVRDDILDLRDGELLAFAGRAPDGVGELDLGSAEGVNEAIEKYLASEIDTLENGATKTFDLKELSEMNFAPGVALREACADVEPDQRVPLVAGWQGGSIHTRDLDGDGRDDWLVIGAPEARAAEVGSAEEIDVPADAVWVIQLLVRR